MKTHHQQKMDSLFHQSLDKLINFNKVYQSYNTPQNFVPLKQPKKQSKDLVFHQINQASIKSIETLDTQIQVYYEFLFIIESQTNLTKWCCYDHQSEALKEIHVHANIYQNTTQLLILLQSLQCQSQMQSLSDYFVLFEDIYVSGNLTPSWNDSLYLVYEYCHESLRDHLRNGNIQEKAVDLISAQIIHIMRLLEDLQISHNNIKCENIYLTDGKVRLAGFDDCNYHHHQDLLIETIHEESDKENVVLTTKNSQRQYDPVNFFQEQATTKNRREPKLGPNIQQFFKKKIQPLQQQVQPFQIPDGYSQNTAPELILREFQCNKNNLWQSGCVIFEMLQCIYFSKINPLFTREDTISQIIQFFGYRQLSQWRAYDFLSDSNKEKLFNISCPEEGMFCEVYNKCSASQKLMLDQMLHFNPNQRGLDLDQSEFQPSGLQIHFHNYSNLDFLDLKVLLLGEELKIKRQKYYRCFQREKFLQVVEQYLQFFHQ